MKKLLLPSGLIILILALTIFQIGFSYTIPHPWSKLNLIFAFLVLFIVITDSGLAVWLSFFIHFLLELFTVSPFGLILFSGTISILITFWLYKIIFTNRSWHAVAALSLTALISYRLLYLIIFAVVSFLTPNIFISWQSIVISSLWEIILTSLAVAFLYIFLSIFFKRQLGISQHGNLFKI